MNANSLFVALLSVLLKLALAMSILTSCTTIVKSRPVIEKDGNGKVVRNSGIEYALCRPVIVAQPQADGRVSFSQDCLPDPDRRYVIHGRTYLGKMTLKVERDPNMLLKEVIIDRDNSAVAAEAIKATGEIRAKQIETEKALMKDEAEAQKAAATEAKNNLLAAQTALESAEVAFRTAQQGLARAELEFKTLLSVYGLDPDSSLGAVLGNEDLTTEVKTAVSHAFLNIETAKTTLRNAIDALEIAKEKMDLAEKKVELLAASGNVPGVSEWTATKRIWGPLIYDIKQETNDLGNLTNVKLEPLFDQKSFESVDIKPSETTLPLTANASGFSIDKTGNREISIYINKPIDRLVNALNSTLTDVSDTTVTHPVDSFTQIDANTLKLVLGSKLPKGKYRLAFIVDIKGKQYPLDLELELNR